MNAILGGVLGVLSLLLFTNPADKIIPGFALVGAYAIGSAAATLYRRLRE